MKPGEFSRKVWKLALSIPSGRVTTYGLLTVAAGGHPMLSRMTTGILSKCPDHEKIPWHRIVYADGRVWLSPKREKERLKLYKQEGIKLDKNRKIINFNELVYTFDN